MNRFCNVWETNQSKLTLNVSTKGLYYFLFVLFAYFDVFANTALLKRLLEYFEIHNEFPFVSCFPIDPAELQASRE